MKKALTFAAAVCGISWIAALLFHLSTGYCGPESGVAAAKSYTTFATLYMFFPMLVALVLRLISGEASFKRRGINIRVSIDINSPMMRFRPRWSWLVGVLLVPVAVGLSILFSALFNPIVAPTEGMLALMAASGVGEIPAEATEQMNQLSDGVLILGTLLSGLVAGVTINALFAYGEEYGWRYHMVEALRGHKFFPSALLIGAVWGIWHAPLILMGHNGYSDRWVGILMMTLFCVLMGILELYFVCKSGTMWPAALMHGTVNALAGFTLIVVPGGDTLLTGMTGLAGAMALVVVIALVALYDRYISREHIFCNTLGTSLGRHAAPSGASEATETFSR